MSDEREMTLEEWVARLPDIHLANKEYQQLKQQIAKLKELLKESIPELESYYRSRRMSDWNNGKSEKREMLINKVKEVLGE